MSEEPLFPVVLSSRKVWNFLRKHPYRFFTIDEIAEATGLKRDTVNSSMMWVTRDPRVVKRRRDKNLVEFGFVRILGFFPQESRGGDEMDLREKEKEELMDVLRRDREIEIQLKMQRAKWEKELAMKKAQEEKEKREEEKPEEEEEKKEKEEDEKQNEE